MKRLFITLIAVTFIVAASAPAFAQFAGQEQQGAPPPSYNQYNPYPPNGYNAATAQPTNPQDADGQADAAQQPGVARVSYISGDVSIQRGDSGDWVAATVNTPVSPGDRISTGPSARAEIQLDYANVLHLAGNAVVTVASLSSGAIQVQVGQGLVSYSVLPNAQAAAEIDTPNVSVRPTQGAGESQFRILVSSDSASRVTVRHGSADVSTPQGSTTIADGQMIDVSGTDNPQYQTSDAYANDDWDRWVSQRDRYITGASSWRNTNRYYTGTESLDNYGRWQNVPDYGQVWSPNVAPGSDWSPYSEGNWVWEPYYGWTWVSSEPWGWAPYHYGRWFVYGGNWVWWPGPVYADPYYYPVWAPAYVSFLGFGGSGFGLGVNIGGFGLFGWLPIGPGDWFHPWWGRWGGGFSTFGFRDFGRAGFGSGFRPLTAGIRGFRGREFSNIRDAATNARVRGGISTMEAGRFGREGVAGHGRSISESDFRRASFISGRNPATPSRSSYGASTRAASPSTIRGGSANSQRFFSASHGFSNGGAVARGAFNNRSPNGVNRARPGNDFNRSAANSPSGFRGNENADRNTGRDTTRGVNRDSNRGAGGRTFGNGNPGAAPGGNRNAPSANSPANGAGSARPGWHSFGQPDNSKRPGGSGTNANEGASQRRYTPQPNPGARGQQPTSPRGGFGNSGALARGEQGAIAGQRGFAPPSVAQRAPRAPEAPRGGFGNPGANAAPRGFSQPPSFNSRGGGSFGSAPHSRPQLNMHQPIATPRSHGGGGGSHGGGSPHGGGGSHTGGGSHGGGGGGGHHRR